MTALENVSPRVRSAFGADLPIAIAIVRVRDCREICDEAWRRIAAAFNTWGFVILEHERRESFREQLLSLKRFFGTVNIHDRSDADGIVAIQVLPGYPDDVATTNKEHLLHTDSAYDDSPPRVLALQCEVPARSGGLTQLVSGQALYDWLKREHPASAAACFRPEALVVQRARRSCTKPVFASRNGRVNVVFRADATARFSEDPEILMAVLLLQRFLFDTRNQLTFRLEAGQVLIADNTALLHGRTEFAKDEPRKLNRINFEGDSSLSEDLLFGFS